MIQSSILIDAIATEKNLHCTDADVDAMLVDYAAKSGIELEKIRNYYSKADQEGRLRYSITEKKVIEEITSSIKIKEVQGKETQKAP